MPERGESSDRGWRYAIFFFSSARFSFLLLPACSPVLRHRANAAVVAVLYLNFFPRSQTRRAFRDDELRSFHRAPAYVVLMQIHAALIWRFLFCQEVREREREKRWTEKERERQNDVSGYRFIEELGCGEQVHICGSCAVCFARCKTR